MTDFKLQCKKAEEKPRELRRQGLIPAIVYGNNYSNIKVALEKTNFMRTFKEAGTSNLIELEIEGEKPVKTLIQETQIDPLNSSILHIDFFKVNMKEKIHADIPLKFVGDSKVVIESEGTLVTPKNTIEVECLPSDLISELEVDISVLDDFEKDIRVSDLKVPAGVEILDDADEVIAHVEEPRSDEEMAELEKEVVEDVSAIEVENKGEETPAEGAEGEKSEEKK